MSEKPKHPFKVGDRVTWCKMALDSLRRPGCEDKYTAPGRKGTVVSLRPLSEFDVGNECVTVEWDDWLEESGKVNNVHPDNLTFAKEK